MSLIYGVQHHIIQTTTTIGMITYRIAKAVTNSNSGTSVIWYYQILNMLKVANLASIIGQTHAVLVNINLLKNLLMLKLLWIRY